MTKRTYRWWILIGLLSMLSFSGCEKFLDHQPDMRTELDSEDKIRRLVTSAYPQQNYLAMMEVSSDNVEDKGIGEMNLPIPSLYKWEDVKGFETNTPTAYWNACYAAIAAANHALAALEEQGGFASQSPEIVGEALLARAYAHFMLVNLFAPVYQIDGDNQAPGIPYITSPEEIVFQDYDRGTVAQVYAHILADIEQGIPLLVDGFWEVPKYHFNLEAAHAFAARVYLFMGNWEKVIEHTNAIFPNGEFTGKLRPYNTTFQQLSFTEAQTLFAKADQPYNLLIAETRSTYQRFTTSRYGMGVNTYMDVYNDSTAAGAKFFNIGGISPGVPHYTPFIWREHFVITNSSAQTGLASLMVPLLTTDEALLNRAEAHIEMGNYGLGIADLDLIASNRIVGYDRQTHGISIEKSKHHFNQPDDKQALVETVLQFKRICLMGEGLRWLDIIRKDIPIRRNIVDPISLSETYIELPAGDPRRVFQLPQDVNLSNLEPNPR